jgi:4-hydroxybenzoate polyprenyltransferase
MAQQGPTAWPIGSPASRVLLRRLQLFRPANLPTAAADILAGFAVAGMPAESGVGLLVLASVFLYAGGVALNDFFDAELDAVERPERPIPSGAVSRASAFWMGVGLLTAGILAAFAVRTLSGIIALALAYLILLYNRWAKQSPGAGPLLMGLCRSANLCLGLSIVPQVLFGYWYLSFIPLLYIGAVTLLSQGEVSGGVGVRERFAAGAVTMAIVAVGGATLLPGAEPNRAAPFLLLLAAAVIPAYVRAARTPEAHVIRGAVRLGVLSIILVDAVWASAFAGAPAGLAVAMLAGLSWGLAKIFAVT